MEPLRNNPSCFNLPFNHVNLVTNMLYIIITNNTVKLLTHKKHGAPSVNKLKLLQFWCVLPSSVELILRQQINRCMPIIFGN